MEVRVGAAARVRPNDYRDEYIRAKEKWTGN